MDKQALRREMLGRIKLAALPDPVTVADCICSLEQYKSAQWVLGYVALKSEIDIGLVLDRALKDGKKIAFPDEKPGFFRTGDERWRESLVRLENRTCTTDGCVLSISQIGARISGKETKGIILVPGLAFTHFGARLGRGAGYYDSVLGLMENSVGADFTSVGVCLEIQLVEDLPRQPHDRTVRMVIAF